MKISFDNSELEKCAQDQRYGRKRLGRLYVVYLHRLQVMRQVDHLEDLRHAPGHFHQLKGRRRGEWACRLSKNFRLVFKPNDFGNLVDNQKDWSWIQHVLILEVIDYH